MSFTWQKSRRTCKAYREEAYRIEPPEKSIITPLHKPVFVEEFL